MTSALIDTPTARRHLRLEDDYPPEQLAVYIGAAELAAADFINRRIYPDAAALAAAIATVPTLMDDARAAYLAAITAADQFNDEAFRRAAANDAQAALDAVWFAATEIRRGIVVDDRIRAAILLAIGHLYVNREDTVAGTMMELPMGSRALLQPLRVGLGV